MELESYSRPTCNKLYASSHDALDRRRGNPQAPSSTSFVDHTIDLPWRNFLSPEFGGKFQREVPYFWKYPIFYNTLYDRSKVAPVPKTSSILLVVSIQYRIVTDGRTDGQTDRRTVSHARCLRHIRPITGNLTLSTKPKVHNLGLLQHCQKRTEPRPQIACTENFVV